jgi:hypothetical protein
MRCRGPREDYIRCECAVLSIVRKTLLDHLAMPSGVEYLHILVTALVRLRSAQLLPYEGLSQIKSLTKCSLHSRFTLLCHKGRILTS